MTCLPCPKVTNLLLFYYEMENLVKEVNEYLKEGFELQGGISISIAGTSRAYAQAMIKKT